MAILAALLALLAVAPRLGLDRDKMWNLGVIASLTALIGSRLVLIVAHFADFSAHPFWMLGISTLRSETAIWSGLVLAAGIGFLYAKAVGLPLRGALDALAPPLALGLAIRNVGAFLAGSDYGTSTALPWAVTYSSRIARLWYGTPLGMSVHPVQIYEALAQVAIGYALVTWIPRRKQEGDLAAIWLFLSGISGFLLDTFHGDLSERMLFNGVLAEPQLVALAMVIAGGLLGLQRRSVTTEASQASEPAP